MSGVLAVVPARDEAERLTGALDALRAQGVDAIVVANGCTDGTASVARRAGARVIETPALRGGVGEARRIGMATALQSRPRWLMTTDADCHLAPGTVRVLERALAGAEAAFGRVEPEPGEFAALPAAVRRHGRLEDRHDALVAQIDGLHAAAPWNPAPCHGQSPGALMAFRPDAYEAAGGFAPLPSDEDRRIAATLARLGVRIARPWDAAVRASCRLTGRAPGGMADTIAARACADLSAETRRLARRCAVLERQLARLASARIGEDERDPQFLEASA